jgi:hypothetical protein
VAALVLVSCGGGGGGGGGGGTTTAGTTGGTPQVADADQDGVADSSDNCPAIANPGQADLDGSGGGDVCDTDDDSDSVADTADNCPVNANADQVDRDGDSTGDACDSSIAWNLGATPAVNVDCLAVSPQARSQAPSPSRDGSWTQFRGDRKLTGRSALVGGITCPRVMWSIDLGARKTWLSLTPGGSAAQIPLRTTGQQGNSWQTRIDYEIDGTLVDLNGDGFQRIDPSGGGRHKVGDLITNVPGFERVACYPDVPGGTVDHCYMHRWSNNSWQQVWAADLRGFTPSAFANNQGGSRPIIGDFDADGSLDVAVLGWYRVHVLNLTTGAHEYAGTFFSDSDDPTGRTTGRAYGWFGAVNIDTDPKNEFVIVGDFEKFVSVLGWSGNQLVESWNHQIEAGTQSTSARVHPGANAVQDIDGDSYEEVVISVFNQSGDRKWHVVAFDGRTGQVELDLAERYLAGAGDLNADSTAELFVASTSNAGVPRFGPSAIVSFANRALSTLWSANAGFVSVETPRFPLHVNAVTVQTAGTNGVRQLFLRSGWTTGNPVFATQEAATGTNVTMRLHQWSGTGVAEIGTAQGPRLKVLSLPSSTPQRGLLVQALADTPAEDRVALTGLTGAVAYSGRVESNDGDVATFKNLTTSSVVGRMGGRPTLVTQDVLYTTRAFEVGAAGVTERWRTSGRGMMSGQGQRSISSVNAFGSLLLADLDGTGDLSVVVADEAPNGTALIKAINASGNVKWSTPLDYPGAPPVWNEAGVMQWMAGRFRSTMREDVLVGTRRTITTSEELAFLDGRTGQIDWRRTDGGRYSGCSSPVHTGGASGINMPSFDVDGDGLDEVLNTYSGLFAMYDGNSGTTQLNRWTTDWCAGSGQIFTPGFLEHGVAVVADFLGNGSHQILYGQNSATMALVETDGDIIWQTPHYQGLPSATLQGVGRFDDDGSLDVLVVGQCGTSGQEIRMHDGATGAVKWTMPLARACEWPGPMAVSTGDIDGDGEDEALIVNGNILDAIGENESGTGETLWRATFTPADRWMEHGYPLIADVDGSGKPQIIVNSALGYVYGLGSD